MVSGTAEGEGPHPSGCCGAGELVPATPPRVDVVSICTTHCGSILLLSQPFDVERKKKMSGKP